MATPDGKKPKEEEEETISLCVYMCMYVETFFETSLLILLGEL